MTPSVPKDKIYSKSLFYSENRFKISKNLTKILSDHSPQIKISVVFNCLCYFINMNVIDVTLFILARHLTIYFIV